MEPETGDAASSQPINSTQRKRTARACDACYKRKIKCDATLPRCNWCAHNNSPCTYERRIVRKKASSKDDRAHLLDRVDRLEKLLTRTLERGIRAPSPHSGLTEQPDSTPSIASTRESSCSNRSRIAVITQPAEQPAPGTLHFAGWRLGTINSSTGIPVFSDQGQKWIRSRTGENVSLERIVALSQSWHSSTRSTWGVPLDMVNRHLPIRLPDQRIVESYLDWYQHSFACHVFPVVDPIRFWDTINTAYRQSSAPFTYQEYSAQACVYAFLAFSTSLSNSSDTMEVASISDEYALKAHRILTVCCLDTTIETLQAACLMNMFHLFSGNLQYSLFEGSICARMIYMLGAHTTSYPSCTDPDIIYASSHYRERYLLRNIFWLCYNLDKELSLRTGQPPCLQDEHCDITLPPPHVQQLYPRIMGYQAEDTYDALHLFPGHPALGIIKSKAYSALYATRAVEKTDTELLRDIRELDDDLERWRLSIPLTHRPTISITRATLPQSANTMLAAMLHLDYCHCVAAIHQATSRCQAWSFGDHDEAEGVGTSLALSIEASRSSLIYLERGHHLLDDDSFWMILYYPMSALLTLFYSMLHRPLDPRSLEDLKLLNGVPSMIRRIPVRRLTKNETDQIQLIDELVEQLTTLGKCAIDKAKGEELTSVDMER